MLLQFRFSNFRSFRDEQELSLIAGPFKDQPEVVLRPSGIKEGVLPVAAIYGANASGKTNVIRAFEFMVSAVGSSHRNWKPDGPIPLDPFVTAGNAKPKPSEFEIDFLVEDVRYCYGFRIDSEAILEEWLYAFPQGKKQTWFHRKQGSAISFSTKMPGENRVIERLTRKNSLFLSAAAQNNHEHLLPVYKWLTELLFVTGDRSIYHYHTAKLCESPDYKSEVAKLVLSADLGIGEMIVEELKPPERVKEMNEALAKLFKLDYPLSAEIVKPRPEIRLLHMFGENAVLFGRDQESAGTIAYLVLLGPAVDAIKKGAILLVDEIDASLHPLLAIQLIRLFNSPSTNPNHAQLIFNTHDTNLLSGNLLRRDQIWFTEKNADASSHLYPLSDFKPRKEENLQSGYLQGRYGAIPFINPDEFLLRFEATNGER
jgi:AAA15 family ATPase/GTPase